MAMIFRINAIAFIARLNGAVINNCIFVIELQLYYFI